MRMVLPVKSTVASIAAFAVCLLIGLSLNHAAKAADFSWLTSGNLQVVSETSLPSHFTMARPGCYESTITIREMEGIIPRTRQAEACVVMGAGMSVAYSGGTYIRYGADSYFYKLASSNWASLFIVPGMNRGMYLQQYSQYSGSALSVFDAIDTHLHFDRQALMYGFSDFSQRLYPAYDDNTSTTDDDIGVSNAFFSNNGRFLVYTKHGSYPVQDRYVRVDLQTGEAKQFGRGWYVYEYSPFPGPQFAVSNDGTHIIGGGITRLKAWEISENCLIDTPSYMDNSPVSNCPNHEIFPESYGKTTDPQSRDAVNRLLFNDDATELSFQYRDPENNFSAITVSPVGYVSTSKLDYLALGDSFSSGEGDAAGLFGKRFYRSGTDEKGPPQEKCHISLRSYPYVIASLRGYASSKWQTVACSGAVVQKDYYGPNDGYLGQGGRLQQLSAPSLAEYKSSGIMNFIPGRNQQIEFVRDNKPKAVTLTGSGNDMGFASILKACIPTSLLGGVEDSCDIASTAGGRYRLIQTIDQQYENVRALVRALKQVSSKTRIYYVGYPQFIASTDKSCGGFVKLSKQERSVFKGAVTYLNNVIKAAVESEGATYIDIENVLGPNGEHALCGSGTAYVNGFNADCSDSSTVRFLAGKDECQEAFHPRPEAHRLMANAISAAMTFQDDGPCGANPCGRETPLSSVSKPSVLNQDYIANYEPVYGGVDLAAQKGSPEGGVNLNVDYLEPNSQAYVYIASTPTEVGNFAVDETGTLHLAFDVPNSIPAGYHTLRVQGSSQSGEAIDMWRIIRIFGQAGDVDEDGIPDASDPCQFMSALGEDKDGDGIDDGCDSNIDIATSQQADDQVSLSKQSDNKSMQLPDGLPYDQRSYLAEANNLFDLKRKIATKDQSEIELGQALPQLAATATTLKPKLLLLAILVGAALIAAMILLRHKHYASKK